MDISKQLKDVITNEDDRKKRLSNIARLQSLLTKKQETGIVPKQKVGLGDLQDAERHTYRILNQGKID